MILQDYEGYQRDTYIISPFILSNCHPSPMIFAIKVRECMDTLSARGFSPLHL